MTKHFIIVFFILFQVNCFGQVEKSISEKSIPFCPINETSPRFLKDSTLSERESKKLFNKRILERFRKYLNTNDISEFLDSISIKVYYTFKIDSLGNSQFKNIRPEYLIESKLVKELTNIVDSFPKFIPATQKNKPVNVFYSIPIKKVK